MYVRTSLQAAQHIHRYLSLDQAILQESYMNPLEGAS